MSKEPLSLTNTALSRLQALAAGNGLADGDLQVIEAKDGVHKLGGSLQLSPHLDVKTQSYAGRCKTKGLSLLPSFAAFDEEMKKRQKSMDEDASWVDLAVAEIKKLDGLGWGRGDTILIWDHTPHKIAATENCRECNGTAQHPCQECKGIGFLPCHYCEARGKELCYHCYGNKTDPVQVGKPCTICHGTGYADCRYCHTTMRLPCPTCHGKGQTPCKSCGGAGAMTREAQIHNAAKLSFHLGATSALPSGLLRAITRIGEANLYKGHADIALALEQPPDKRAIRLEATLAHADIKIRIGKKSGMIACTGKKARLSGVPAFLDEALIPARRELARAAQGAISLENAAKTARLIGEALGLALTGKTHSNELRRLYPVGLSANVAQEIMAGVARALRAQTFKIRLGIGAFCTLLSGALFAGALFTPLAASLGIGAGGQTAALTNGTAGLKIAAALSPSAILLMAAVPAVVMAGCWLLMVLTTRAALRRLYPAAQLSRTQAIGKTGAAMLAFILALYLALIAARFAL